MAVIVVTLGYALYQIRGDQWFEFPVRQSVSETMAEVRSLTGEEQEDKSSKVATSVEQGMGAVESSEEEKNHKEQEEGTETEEANTEITTEAAEEKVEETAGKPLYYTVQKGDTLAAISRRMYTTDQYASKIAQANDLSNENEIYIGQKLLIPSVK